MLQESMRGFQKQTTTIILKCLDGLDPETFYNNNYIFHDGNCCYRRNSTLLQKMCVYKKITVKSR